jgi:hypothetical protein
VCVCVCVCVFVCFCATQSYFSSQFYGFCTQMPFFNFGSGVYCAEWENTLIIKKRKTSSSTSDKVENVQTKNYPSVK